MTQFVAASGGAAEGVPPVSYTHLDVYKRQVENELQAMGAEERSKQAIAMLADRKSVV